MAQLIKSTAMSCGLPFESVSDTAYVTAFSRALETERSDAHFRDPYARMLAGAWGEQALRRMPGAEFTAASCIIRTCLFDDLLLDSVMNRLIDTVINLGAGLDTRPYRLPLPPNLRWIEVDHPAVLDYKASKLAGHSPACQVESAPLDVTNVAARQALLDRVADAAFRALVITEGLIVYMTADQVASLAYDLFAFPTFQCWLVDLVSPTALQLMGSTLVERGDSSAVKLLFAPREGPKYFQRYGWHTASCLSCLEEGRRLDRWFLAKEALAIAFSAEHWQMLQRLYMVAALERTKPGNDLT